MGIDGIRNLLKSKAKIACDFFEVEHDLSKYKNIKIAVDSCIFIHTKYHGKKKSVIRKMDPSFGGYNDEYFEQQMFKEVIKSVVDNLECFLSYNIEPIFVFETPNEYIAQAKNDERIKRSKPIMKNITNYNDLVSFLDGMSPNGKQLKAIQDSYVNSKRPNNDFIMRVMDFLDKIRVSTILCDCEGEKFCVMLQHHKMVHAVYSKDTDCYAMGCRYIISDINIYKKTINIVYYNRILNILRMTSLQFRDLCILCGTDFNHRIKGFGPSSIYDLIKRVDDYQNIYQLCGMIQPRAQGHVLQKSDFECINYDLCVEMFEIGPIDDNVINHNDAFNDITVNNIEIFRGDLDYREIISSILGYDDFPLADKLNTNKITEKWNEDTSYPLSVNGIHRS